VVVLEKFGFVSIEGDETRQNINHPGTADAKAVERGLPTTPSPISVVPEIWTSFKAEQDWRALSSTTGAPKAEEISMKGTYETF